MKYPKKYEKIEEVKQEIIDTALIASSVIGFLAYLISLKNSFSGELQISAVTDLIVLLLFFAVAFFRKKISINFKVWIILLGLLVLILVDIYRLDIFSANKMLLALIPFFSILAFSKKRIIFVYFLSIVAVVVLAYLHSTKVLTLSSQAITGLVPWVVNLILITIVSVVFLLITFKFNKTYEGLIDVLKLANREIVEKEQTYREIFNSSTDAIFIHALNGEIVDVRG